MVEVAWWPGVSVIPLVDEGLGKSAYPVDLTDGGALAMGAASLLTRAGYRDVTVLDGGPQDWAGRSLEVTQ